MNRLHEIWQDLAEKADDIYMIKLGGYVSLKEALSVFGSIPELPWNREKLDMIQSRLSKKAYVFLSAYEEPFTALKEAAKNGQQIIRLRIADLGYHALDIVRELQSLGERARIQGIECLLRNIEVKPDFSGARV